MEVKILACMILQKYRLQHVQGHKIRGYGHTVTLFSSSGVLMIPEKRENTAE
jgi:hypothetical protein